MKKIKRSIVLILLFCIVVLSVCLRKDLKKIYNLVTDKEEKEIVTTDLHAEDNSDLLEIHFIDVGQGDATLIKYKEHSMLIDAGDNTVGTELQNYLNKQGIKRLDYVVGTHPDGDHIGGLDVILYKFECNNIIMPNVTKDTKSYDDVIDVIEEKNYEITSPEIGEEFYLGDVKFTIVGPDMTKVYDDINNYSVVLRMDYKDISMMLSGDSGFEAMKHMVDSGMDLDVDIYKVAHHGSADSYNKRFLEEMSADFWVVSCGEDNDYGHPHREIIDYVDKENIELYRTDKSGDIIFYSDGSNIEIMKEK